MANLIPPIGSRGRFTVASPFTVNSGVVYRCTALRRFSDIENQGIRVFETFYEPFDLTQTDVANDRSIGAYIATLESDTHAPIYVPTTYITSYPDGAYRNYQRVVISAELGPMPDYIDLTFMEAQLKALVSDTIGVEPRVALGAAPMDTTVTPDQHETLEIARVNAIKNRTTDYAKYLAEKEANQRLKSRIQILEEIIRRNGLIPE
jgi:hypothetical protein